MRLTKKEKNRLSCHSYRECDYLLNGTRKVDALNKLGQLENIEEELGIDLVTLFKALKEPAYVIINGKIVETQCGYIGEECKDIKFEVDGEDYKNLYDIETYYVLIKDYGKTWALTKEELL